MSFITTRALFYQFTESSITASFPPIHSHKPSTHSHIQTASVEVGSDREWNTRTHTMLNLLSDESDEEQDGEHVYSPCCRNGLYIAQTKLAGSDGGRLPFRGLFASKVPLCGSIRRVLHWGLVHAEKARINAGRPPPQRVCRLYLWRFALRRDNLLTTSPSATG